MQEETIIVKEWVVEARPELDKFVSDAIINKKKIHIGAPVGTGKTSYAIDLIKEYQDNYQFVILEPLKSITGQLNARIFEDDEVVDAFEYNYNKRRELEEWEERFDRNWPHTFLSTIDSAWRLFDEDKLDPDKTIIIIDESHTLIQDGRQNFDRSVDAIINAGCPVIGFSATVSSWVIEYLFKMDLKISIQTTDISDKVIYQFVETKIPKIIAYEIKEQNYSKVIIWTETFENQDNIYNAIVKLTPDLKVIKLNATERDSSGAADWKYIIEKEVLPPDTNVAIINKVAQAGININDKNIDLVILFGKFDPYGFQQYLGRTRYYTGEFYFLYYDYGGSKKDWEEDDERENYQMYIQDRIDRIDEINVKYQIDIPPGLEDVYTHLTNGSKGYRLNKCMYANKIYKRYRDLHGTNLIKVIKELDPTLIFHKAAISDDLLNQIRADEKAEKRNTKMVLLPNSVMKYAKDIILIGTFYKSGMKHNDVQELIKASTGNARDAKKKRLLHIPKTRKDGLTTTITTALEANVSIQRLIVAATEYADGGKDETVMKALLDPDQVTVQRITQLMGGIQYYNQTYKKYDRYINSVLNKISPMASDKTKNRRSATMWKKQIVNFLKGIRRTLPKELPAQILKYNLFATETKMKDKITGKDKNVLKLKQVVMTYNDYITANNLYKFNK